ncbi:hypothetical protein BKA61DRAFT_608054 [Leptodontidium sp. MPI-SDFR-AT-0119]|nr:hypothetical protein BKA61DRAFT_608054 [Leptodontidium sp. MPI-SDFR-AT-0119]
MGIIFSCLNIAKSQYKTSKSASSKPTSTPPQTQASAQAPDHQQQEQPPPLDPTPAPVREGLAVEHLATSPPPIHEPSAQQKAGESDKSLQGGSSAVTPALGLGTATSASATTRVEVEGDKDKDTGVGTGEGAGTMATDEDYMSFLDKANQDPNEGVARAQGSGKVEFKTTDEGVKVPGVIEKVLGKGDAFYVSDADEPFVGVALKLSGKGLPDEAAFAKLINHPKPKEADVQIMDVGEWDTQGQYKDVVEATREAVKGSDVRVYRVVKDGSRVEYWVVGVEGGELVGVKALAVES